MKSFQMDRTRWIMLAILVLAFAERALWNSLRATSGAEGEAMNVAQAIAAGRGFADAYRAGGGPTAHLTPVTPLLAGGIYAILGSKSLLSEIVLATWSIGLALGTYLLLFRAFGRIGVPLSLRLFAFAWGCLAPTYISQEAVDFRVWEGGLATFVAALFFDRLMGLVQMDESRPWPVIQAALIGGVLFFINPPMGLGAIACMTLFAIRNLSIKTTLAAAGAGAAAIALLVAPWMIRNAQVLGAPVPLRSNAGLELALSNYPGAEKVEDVRHAYIGRINTVHPTVSDEAYRQMQAMGEVAYSDALGDMAVNWIKAHPAAAFAQSLDHVREMFVPSAWKFNPVGESRASWFKVPLAQATGILGILGMLIAIRRLGSAAWYPVLYVVTVALLISPFQPVVRYMYVISPLLVNFMACVGLLLPAFARQGRLVRRTGPDRHTANMDGNRR